jgi:hypothetical protein
LFQYFVPKASIVPFGKGKIVFHWGEKLTIPTHWHFIRNWQWADGHTHGARNWARKNFAEVMALRPIWGNFAEMPADLAAAREMDAVEAFLDRPNKFRQDALAHAKVGIT